MNKLRVLYFLLAVGACLLLGSCGGRRPADEGQSTAQGTGTDTAPETDGEMVLFSSDTGALPVWVAQSLWQNAEVRQELETLTATVRKRTGLELSLASDRSAADADAEKPAILIGSTRLSDGTDPLRNRDFAVRRSGTRLLLEASAADSCISAIRYFNNKVLIPQKGSTLVWRDSMAYSSSYSYPIGSITMDGKELGCAPIILSRTASNAERYLANWLSYYLNEQYGYRLPVLTDNASPVAGEILVGATNRLQTDTTPNRYAVSVCEGKLCLSAGDARGYEALYSYLLTEGLRAGENAHYAFDAADRLDRAAEGVIADGTLLATERRGNVRVMFYNLFGGTDGSAGASSVRLAFQLELIGTYLPDVLGLQECSPERYWAIGIADRLAELGYREVTVPQQGTSYTPLFYRTDRLTLKDSGTLIYSGTNNANSKGLTWGVFETQDARQFAVINTHFMYDESTFGSNRADRVRNAGELLETVSKLTAAYGNLPMLMGGDLNDIAGSEPLKALEAGGLSDAWQQASVRNDTSGKHPYPTYSPADKVFVRYEAPKESYEKAIDHVFAGAGTDVQAVVYLTSPWALFSSDHMPLICELNI